MQWQGPGGLIRISQPSKPFPKAQHIPIACEHHYGDLLLAQAVLQLQGEVYVVDARHVARAGGRRVLWMQREGIYVHKAVGNIGVELIGLHQTEPRTRLVREAGLVVEVERGGDDRVPVVDAGPVEPVVALLLALAAHGPHELDDGVVEIELQADLRVAGLHLERLVLDDEHLIVSGCEFVALDGVQVDVAGLEARREVVGGEAARGGAVLDDDVGAGHDDASLEALEVHVYLDTVELQGGEREGLARMLGEPEGQGDVESPAGARVDDELRARVPLANHLGETTARFAGELLPHEEEIVVKGVDCGATDDDARGADEELADVVGPVSPDAVELGAEGAGAVLGLLAALERCARAVLVASPPVLSGAEHLRLGGLGGLGKAIVDVFLDDAAVGVGAGGARLRHVGELVARTDAGAPLGVRVARGDAGQVDDNVHVVDEVTVAVKCDLGFATEGDGRIEGLTDAFHRKIGVFVVAHLPEGERGVCRQILVKSTLGNQLCEGTRARGSRAERGHFVFNIGLENLCSANLYLGIFWRRTHFANLHF